MKAGDTTTNRLDKEMAEMDWEDAEQTIKADAEKRIYCTQSNVNIECPSSPHLTSTSAMPSTSSFSTSFSSSFPSHT